MECFNINMSYVYLSLGSNLDDRIKNIKKAIREISKISKIIKISPFYITKPMYYENQPYFINCIVKIKTKITPNILILKLLNIEQKIGRVRTFKNAPRIIDIDIIYYDKIIMNTNDLKIPHPKRLERIFVLKPLLDIEPNLKDPLTQNTVRQELKKLKTSFILKVPQNYQQSVEFLSLLNPRKKNDFKTDYIKQALNAIGNPQDSLKNIIHITGSVGKSSTALYISKILSKEGFSTAIYISPHIKDVRERIILNNKIIRKNEFTKILIDILSKSIHLCSAFEYLTVIAIKFFSYNKPDFSIIEVGMGGRNDATNIFNKTTAVFTTITKEHTKYLGKSLKEIALNKADIIKEKSKVFISSYNNKDVINVIKTISERKNAAFYISPKLNEKNIEKNNFFLSKWICENILNKKINIDFFQINLPSRLQKTNHLQRDILLDGAHTPISIKKLLENIDIKKYSVCLCSFMKDKNYKKCINEIIKKDFKKIIITKSFSPRSFNPDKIRIKCKRFYKIKDIQKAFRKAISLGNVLVCGSLYFCGDILSLIKKEKRIYLNELI